jgi:hypothetical protein
MTVCCNSAEPERNSSTQAMTTPVAQDSLEQIAGKLSELYNSKNCKEFINTFPSSFELLDQLYGYDDGRGGRRLYSKYEEHISYFSNCSEVPNRVKLDKVINIGLGGRWEADASGLLQEVALKLVKDDPNTAKEILNALPDDKASSFWFYLFDGPHPGHPQKVKDIRLLRDLLGKKSKQSKLLLEQYKELLALNEEDKASGVIH